MNFGFSGAIAQISAISGAHRAPKIYFSGSVCTHARRHSSRGRNRRASVLKRKRTGVHGVSGFSNKVCREILAKYDVVLMLAQHPHAKEAFIACQSSMVQALVMSDAPLAKAPIL